MKGSKKARKANDFNSENVSEGGRTKNNKNKILPQRRLCRKKSGILRRSLLLIKKSLLINADLRSWTKDCSIRYYFHTYCMNTKDPNNYYGKA